jgi:hypothetical protein
VEFRDSGFSLKNLCVTCRGSAVCASGAYARGPATVWLQKKEGSFSESGEQHIPMKLDAETALAILKTDIRTQR